MVRVPSPPDNHSFGISWDLQKKRGKRPEKFYAKEELIPLHIEKRLEPCPNQGAQVKVNKEDSEVNGFLGVLQRFDPQTNLHEICIRFWNEQPGYFYFCPPEFTEGWVIDASFAARISALAEAPELAVTSVGPAVETKGPLRILVCGAGPVGLAFAISLAERALAREISSLELEVTIVDLRLTLEDGSDRFKWSNMKEVGSRPVQNRRREQIVTLQHTTLVGFDDLKLETRNAFCGDRVWRSSENVAIRGIEDDLLERVQQDDVKKYVKVMNYPEEIRQEIKQGQGNFAKLKSFISGHNADLVPSLIAQSRPCRKTTSERDVHTVTA